MTTNHVPINPIRWSRRDAARLLGGALALAATSQAVAASDRNKQRRRKPKFRTVTRTFSSGLPIAITGQGAASPYPSAIQVSGFKRGKLLDVNVSLKNLTLTDPQEVDVLLVAPNGRRAVIMSDAGGGFGVSDITLILDDRAAVSLPEFLRLGSGRFRPTNNPGSADDVFPPPAPAGGSDNVKLATFAGINPNGSWRLFVADDVSQDTGSMAGGWSLRIKARVRA